MRVIVTGGLGYIGAHICVELINEGFEPHIVDDLSNSSLDTLENIEKVFGTRPALYKVDIRDEDTITSLFHQIRPAAVIHCAALKDVAESFDRREAYNAVNVEGTQSLLNICATASVEKLIFSSSVAVYGVPNELPILESSRTSPISPYGQSKLDGEGLIQALSGKSAQFNSIILRCSNPVGAHPSGALGELALSEPSSLMPAICRAAKTGEPVNVFGADYPTEDGTAKRDYIHVVDVAKAHVAALKYLDESDAGSTILNVGMGRSYSVLEMIECFERVNGQPIARVPTSPREGDAAESYSKNSKAISLLNWTPKYDLEEMCMHSWKWCS